MVAVEVERADGDETNPKWTNRNETKATDLIDQAGEGVERERERERHPPTCRPAEADAPIGRPAVFASTGRPTIDRRMSGGE